MIQISQNNFCDSADSTIGGNLRRDVPEKEHEMKYTDLMQTAGRWTFMFPDEVEWGAFSSTNVGAVYEARNGVDSAYDRRTFSRRSRDDILLGLAQTRRVELHA